MPPRQSLEKKEEKKKGADAFGKALALPLHEKFGHLSSRAHTGGPA